jgi:hypothetical protein
MYLIMLLMQPSMPFEQQLRYGFAILSSQGQLDLEVTDKIPFGESID